MVNQRWYFFLKAITILIVGNYHDYYLEMVDNCVVFALKMINLLILISTPLEFMSPSGKFSVHQIEEIDHKY